MRKILYVFLIIVLTATIASAGEVFDRVHAEAEVHSGVKEISYDQFMELRNSGEKYTLLDVLPEESYKKGHIPGAENFPLMDMNAESAAEKLPKDANIVVYCVSFKCKASVMAAKELGEFGYKNVVDYKGGLKEWQEKGNELVK